MSCRPGGRAFVPYSFSMGRFLYPATGQVACEDLLGYEKERFLQVNSSPFLSIHEGTHAVLYFMEMNL